MTEQTETECWPKTGFVSGERYCGKHGRSAGWPCSAPVARLAEALRPWLYPEEGGHLYRERIATEMAGRVATALLPVVRELQAEALRAAEREATHLPDCGWSRWLNDRAAAALRGEAGQ
jgi:hypothetical protein